MSGMTIKKGNGKQLLLSLSLAIQKLSISLSPCLVPLLLLCFSGEESLAPDFLIESFKLYVSQDEKEVIEKSLEGDLEFCDGDLLDLLGSFKCYKSPTNDNIFASLHELAHQEIVQKPRYMVDCLAPILNSMRVYTPFQTMPEDLKTFYNAEKPSSKKIISRYCQQVLN